MNAYYTQIADQIFPIYGVNSMAEAMKFIPAEDHSRIVETADDVYMNAATGSVDFESNWTAEGVDLDDLTKVTFDAESESWIAA